MALRRHAERLKGLYHTTDFSIGSEILMKTNLCDFTVKRDSGLFEKLTDIYKLVDYPSGDMLNVIHGNYESSIIINDRFKKDVDRILKKDIINFEEDLVSLSFKVSDKFVRTPGVIAGITRRLLWEGINIIEIITTCTEINVIVHKDHAVNCYRALEELSRI